MKKKGFTIIELLVVIAIIAILVSISLALFGGPRAKSRDARREQDMKTIHNALSLYINNNGAYPQCALTTIDGTSDCLSSALINANTIIAVPPDIMPSGTCSNPPSSTAVHSYCYISDGTTFVLYYNRETGDNKPVGWNFITP